MYLQTPFLLVLATLLGLATAAPSSEDHANVLVSRANPKANEYKSKDCSGKKSYGHQPGVCFTCIKMDTTTNSVYIATGDAGNLMPAGWQAFASDDCTGSIIPGQGRVDQQGGSLQDVNGGKPCVGLDLFPGYRINSILYNICIHDCWYGPTCPTDS